METRDDRHEASPLLGEQCDGGNHATKHSAQSSLQRHLSKWWTVYVCAVLIITLDVPSFMSEGPELRMLELAVCRDFYAAHDLSVIDDNGNVAEQRCKIPEIQSALAKLRGIMAMMEAIPGLLLAVPYRMLADKWGRTLVLGLALSGFVLKDGWTFTVLYFYRIFPLKAVYAAALLVAVGGGPTVAGPMFLAIVAASVPPESRYNSHAHEQSP